MTQKTTEQQLNSRLSELYESYERSLPRLNQRVIRAVVSVRLTIADILSKYTDSSGKIPKNKASQVVNEIVAMEGEIYRNLRDELRAVISGAAVGTTIGLAEVLVAVLGAAALVGFLGIGADIASLPVGIAEALFGALVGSSVADYSDSITESVFNRKAEDGKQLNDRLKSLSETLRKETSATIRKSIANGEGVSGILRKVSRKFEDLSWRVKTIVETEVLFAHRQVIGIFAEKSGIAAGVKIVDYPHGDPKEHARHKCYVYARQDEHGMGTGVYPVSTRKVRHPHPRCRSTLHLVLVGKLN